MDQSEELQPPTDPEERAAVGPLLLGGGFFLALAGGVGWLLLGSDSSDVFTYSKFVDEVMDAPGDFAGRDLRVEGDLRSGSLCFQPEPCEWRFVLEKDGRTMPVRFAQCVVPDTFRDMPGVVVTVQGQLGEDGRFEATQVVPRCPSKYEEGQMPEGTMPTTGEMAPPATASPQPLLTDRSRLDRARGAP